MKADEVAGRIDHGRHSLRRREVMAHGEASATLGEIYAIGHNVFLIYPM
jgi:hypothetical protein